MYINHFKHRATNDLDIFKIMAINISHLYRTHFKWSKIVFGTNYCAKLLVLLWTECSSVNGGKKRKESSNNNFNNKNKLTLKNMTFVSKYILFWCFIFKGVVLKCFGMYALKSWFWYVLYILTNGLFLF